VEEGLRLDNLTKNPLFVSSRYQIPSNGSLILRESEYLFITDEIVELSELGKLSYVFLPIERRVLPQNTGLKVEKKRDLPTDSSLGPLIKKKIRKD